MLRVVQFLGQQSTDSRWLPRFDKHSFFGALPGEDPTWFGTTQPRTGKGFVEGGGPSGDGVLPLVTTSPPSGWLLEGYDDSSWPTTDLSMWSTDYYTFGLWASPPTRGRGVDDIAGNYRWAFRAHVEFPPSPSIVELTPSGYLAPIHFEAQPGHALYVFTAWLDNFGFVIFDDGPDAGGDVLTGYASGGDYTGVWLLEATPGTHFIVVSKEGDAVTDGLSIKLATVDDTERVISGGNMIVRQHFEPDSTFTSVHLAQGTLDTGPAPGPDAQDAGLVGVLLFGSWRVAETITVGWRLGRDLEWHYVDTQVGTYDLGAADTLSVEFTVKALPTTPSPDTLTKWYCGGVNGKHGFSGVVFDSTGAGDAVFVMYYNSDVVGTVGLSRDPAAGETVTIVTDFMARTAKISYGTSLMGTLDLSPYPWYTPDAIALFS